MNLVPVNVSYGPSVRNRPCFGSNDSQAQAPEPLTITTTVPEEVQPSAKKSDVLPETLAVVSPALQQRKTLLVKLKGLLKSIGKRFEPDLEKRCTRNYEIMQLALDAEYYLKTQAPTAKVAEVDAAISAVKYAIKLEQGPLDRIENQIKSHRSNLAAKKTKLTQRQQSMQKIEALLKSQVKLFETTVDPKEVVVLEKMFKSTQKDALAWLDKDLRPTGKLLKHSQKDASIKPKYLAMLNSLFEQQSARIAQSLQRIEMVDGPKVEKAIATLQYYQKPFLEKMAPLKEQLAQLEVQKEAAQQALTQVSLDKTQALADVQGEYTAQLKTIQDAKKAPEPLTPETPIDSATPVTPDIVEKIQST